MINDINFINYVEHIEPGTDTLLFNQEHVINKAGNAEFRVATEDKSGNDFALFFLHISNYITLSPSFFP